MFAVQCAKQFAKSLFPIATSNNITMMRFASKSSKDCKPPAPRCGPEMIKKLVAAGCRKTITKIDYEVKPPSFRSMWENPECCKQPCPDMLPRFDELYYQSSDKSKKMYRQTWVECPEKRIVRKAVCDYKTIKYPQLEKRPRKVRPKTACEIKPAELDCKLGKNDKCIRICMPGCKGARIPPNCFVNKKVAKCRKTCCPYPSYSECNRTRPMPRRKIECNCVKDISMCEAWEIMRIRLNIKGGYTPL